MDDDRNETGPFAHAPPRSSTAVIQPLHSRDSLLWKEKKERELSMQPASRLPASHGLLVSSSQDVPSALGCPLPFQKNHLILGTSMIHKEGDSAFLLDAGLYEVSYSVVMQPQDETNLPRAIEVGLFLRRTGRPIPNSMQIGNLTTPNHVSYLSKTARFRIKRQEAMFLLDMLAGEAGQNIFSYLDIYIKKLG